MAMPPVILGRFRRVARTGTEASELMCWGPRRARRPRDFTPFRGKVLRGYDQGAGRSGGTGRRAGLKIRFPSGSVGSIPTFGTRSPDGPEVPPPAEPAQ